MREAEENTNTVSEAAYASMPSIKLYKFISHIDNTMDTKIVSKIVCENSKLEL